MPGAFDTFQNTFNTSMQLLLKKKAMDQEAQQFQAVMGQKKMELAQEAEQAKQKAAAAQVKDAIESADEMFKRATELKNPELATRAAEARERLGMAIGQPPMFPRDPMTGQIKIEFQEEEYHPSKAQMEGEYLKTGDPKLLKNLKTLDAATRAPRAPGSIKTWMSPEGDIKNLYDDQLPPPGYVPYSPPKGEEKSDTFKNERDLRKEFLDLPEVKEFPIIESQVMRLNKAMAENEKGGSKLAVDQSLIVILNKLLDPPSVVRESEYARTSEDLSVLNKWRGKVEQLKSGGAGLTDDDRAAIARMGKNFYDVSKSLYDRQKQSYSTLAENYGYAPENVIRHGGRDYTIGEDDKSANKSRTAGNYLKKFK